MRVRSVNVGLPREVPWRGQMVSTAIFKDPVDGPVHIDGINIDGINLDGINLDGARPPRRRRPSPRACGRRAPDDLEAVPGAAAGADGSLTR